MLCIQFENILEYDIAADKKLKIDNDDNNYVYKYSHFNKDTKKANVDLTEIKLTFADDDFAIISARYIVSMNICNLKSDKYHGIYAEEINITFNESANKLNFTHNGEKCFDRITKFDDIKSITLSYSNGFEEIIKTDWKGKSDTNPFQYTKIFHGDLFVEIGRYIWVKYSDEKVDVTDDMKIISQSEIDKKLNLEI